MDTETPMGIAWRHVGMGLVCVASLSVGIGEATAGSHDPPGTNDCSDQAQKLEWCEERAEKKARSLERKLRGCNTKCDKNQSRCERNSHRQRPGARSCDERLSSCRDKCDERFTSAGRCDEQADRFNACLNKVKAACQAQQACVEDGRCGVEQTTWSCKATSAEHCQDSKACASSGQCRYASGACVAIETSEDCTGTPMCRQSGLCFAHEGRCSKPTDALCAATEACKNEGKCRIGPELRCAAMTAEDCINSLACKKHKRCGAADGACIDEAAALRHGFSLEQFRSSLFDDRAKAIQARMSVMRVRKREMLQKLVNKHVRNRNHADHLFRLAEAWHQEAKYQYLLAREKYDQAYECYEEKRCTEEPPEPAEDLSTALVYYRKILQEHPGYRRINEVIYHLGRAALDTGKSKKDVQLQKEGVRRLAKLVQKYPKSRYVPQSHLALAEYYFETGSLFYAKSNYEKIVVNFKAHPMYNYAMYKLSWVWVDLTEVEKAVSGFKLVRRSIPARGNRALEAFRTHVDACIEVVEKRAAASGR